MSGVGVGGHYKRKRGSQLFFCILKSYQPHQVTSRQRETETERQTYSQIARESREVKTLNTVSNERIKTYILRKREMKRDMDGQAD